MAAPLTTDMSNLDQRPYFLWDEGLTVGQLKEALANGDGEQAQWSHDASCPDRMHRGRVAVSHSALVLPQTVQVAASRALAGLQAPSEEPWAEDRMHQRQIETMTRALVVHSPCPPAAMRFGLPDAAVSAVRAMSNGEAWLARLEAAWKSLCGGR